MNPLSEQLITGIAGELLVQLRLLQYGVQAAPPLADSGNYLIAVRGESFRTIQVKTTASDRPFDIPHERRYHILALVRLHGEGEELYLDNSEVYLIDRARIERGAFNQNILEMYRISQTLVDSLF